MKSRIAAVPVVVRRALGAAYCLIEAAQQTPAHHLARQMRSRELQDLSAMKDADLEDMGLSPLKIRAAARSSARCLPPSS